MKEVIERVLPLVVPGREEVERAKAAERELRRRLDELGVEYMFVGSYARNTWLGGNLEIDVFVLFPPDLPREELERRGLEVGKAVLDEYEIRYAEHPYVHGKIAGVEADIVPCYKVESPAKIKSAVDRTPFHHMWLKDRIKGKENDVRILKRFLKANRLYGAEYKVRGFSGYLCELLVVFYGSFENVVKAARSWTRRTVIDVARNEVRRGERFFVVDPVDERRNVAANLSLDNLARFVLLCREFVEKPSEDYFFEKKVEVDDRKVLEALKLRESAIFALEFERPEIVEDNLYPQLERAARKIREMLEREGFRPLKAAYFADTNCYLLFECEVKELSRVFKREGPPFEEDEHVKRFLRKERPFKPFIENGRLLSFELRKFTKPQEAVADFVAKNWKSLGKNVGEVLSKGFKILEGEELLKIKEELAEFMGVKT
ncbi:MAG: CCA tRNA nucleotidyltransferase [Archaeoglobaceae archaeon]